MEEKENNQTITDKKENKNIIKKPNKIVRFFILLTIIGVVLFMDARYLNTSGLKIKEYKIESELIPASFHGFKIVHFSDLHYLSTVFEPELENLVNQINQLKPDIVVFTGDLIDKDHQPNDQQLKTLQNYLNKINATLFKYAISGNHDYHMEDISKLYENTGFKYLENAKEDIYYEGPTPISLYAFPSSLKGNPDYSILNEENNNFKIILIHEPDSINNIIDYQPNLVLAGHSHGGQVRLPILGSVYTPVGSKKYPEAFYQINNSQLYVSSGIGTTALRIRFLNKPSINLYRFYHLETN